MVDKGTLRQTLINKRVQDSAHSQSPSGSNAQGTSQVESTSADVSSMHQLGQSRSLTGRWHSVERLRHDLNDLPPSYSDPGVA
ncbi:hypothetical protein ACEPAG_4749 [Sanghuangporus baumii]